MVVFCRPDRTFSGLACSEKAIDFLQVACVRMPLPATPAMCCMFKKMKKFSKVGSRCAWGLIRGHPRGRLFSAQDRPACSAGGAALHLNCPSCCPSCALFCEAAASSPLRGWGAGAAGMGHCYYGKCRACLQHAHASACMYLPPCRPPAQCIIQSMAVLHKKRAVLWLRLPCDARWAWLHALACV